MSDVPDNPTSRPSMGALGALIAAAILFVLGAALFWQRTANAISEIRAAEQQDAAQISELQKQVQGAGPGDTSQLDDLKKQLAAEQGERKLLANQVSALSARLDSLLKTNAAEPAASPEAAKRQRRR